MRSLTLQNVLDTYDNIQYGLTIQEAHDLEICVDCKQPAIEFNDELSKKEYKISGWCQQCQNEIFNGENL